ncbi:esterase/lipase family protein [Lysobacter enzymogenes]|uniref:esterase/lipase family protein n=1 Tax=Lysobacter enzymogenes TaxID=69 RepID=UPI001A964E9F|nr:alpha/beta fold hydrolase [Lysobacter enzymogenes]QQP98077.1 alpha/beta fold hydrolase [Lysobacter enzymogenes]
MNRSQAGAGRIADRNRFGFRLRAAVAALIATLALLAGCGGGSGTTSGGATGEAAEPPAASADTGLNQTDPRWVRQSQPHARIAVVFIHGIFGDTLGTWTHANGKSFFDYLASAPEVGDKVDIYAFGFTSRMFGQGSQDIREASIKLNDYLQYHGVDQYDTVVFVAHSMGGLVAMRELTEHPKLSAKVPLMVFYATPQEGSDITRIARYVVSNNAIRQMLPADGNDFLKDLSDRWSNLRGSGQAPKVICAYETMKTHGELIVPWSSATRFCDEAAPGIADADHLSIVKPDRQEHESVVKLVVALRKYALPRIQDASWETPEFVPDADVWRYTLLNADEINHAGLINRSDTAQNFRIALPQGSKLLILPEVTPQRVAAGAREDLKLLVFGAPQPEYRFGLQLASLPERTVVVRIADLAAAQAARARALEHTAQAINAHIDAGGEAAFAELPDSEKWQQVAQAAQDSIAASAPELPAGARWAAAAEALSALGLADSSKVALRTVAQEFPQTARVPAVLDLDKKVEVQVKKKAVLEGPQSFRPKPVSRAMLLPVQASTEAKPGAAALPSSRVGTLAGQTRRLPSEQGKPERIRPESATPRADALDRASALRRDSVLREAAVSRPHIQADLPGPAQPVAARPLAQWELREPPAAATTAAPVATPLTTTSVVPVATTQTPAVGKPLALPVQDAGKLKRVDLEAARLQER